MKIRIALSAVAVLLLTHCLATEPAPSDPRRPLPGAEAYPGELAAEIAAALEAKGKAYQPRTRHLNQDGSPTYTNRLIFETSPYLTQHAHNPVNWYPWGEAAFAEAARLGRPVLLSIGYSTCHWCHVMEEQSFEDEEVAAYINAHYVAIKVDREERPDVDAIYMQAVRNMSKRGGWPMTTWLNAERKPFFGGTYFPRDMFLKYLREMKQAYELNPDQVAQRAEQVALSVEQGMRPPEGDAVPEADKVHAIVASYRNAFDPVHGGLRRAPKFPSTLPVRLLLRDHRTTGDAQVLQMATLTLDRMAEGGIYDQVGGGFHRYATDVKWLVPHFEKMLYDNAQLALAYLEAYQVTGERRFADVAGEVLDYVTREMTSPTGGFYSATDADSLNPEGHREEGWFFTWTPAEIRALLSESQAKLVEGYYGVTEKGNFEGRTILTSGRELEAAAVAAGIPQEKAAKLLDSARKKMYRARAGRPAPLLDDKILTSWNGLMISAFAQGGFVLDEDAHVRRASEAADFVLENLRRDGRLLRSFKDGEARFTAYLEDYAFFTAALLDLYEVTSELRWLDAAVELQAKLDEFYGDPAAGGYFRTSKDHEALLTREKPAHDGAQPSGNSVAAMNLLRLNELTGKEAYRTSARRLLEAFSKRMRGSSTMLMAVDFYHDLPKEIVIVTAGGREDAAELLDVLRRRFLPNKVVAVVRQGEDLNEHGRRVPLVRGKVARDGEATAYVCERGSCRLPTTDPDVFEEQLSRRGKVRDEDRPAGG